MTYRQNAKLGQNDKLANRFRKVLLGVVVPCAMVLTSTAFATGFYFQGGFGLVSSLIAGITLFLVMICAQAAYISSQRAAQAVVRLGELEATVHGGLVQEGSDGRLEEMSEKVGQIDGMAARMDRIDGMSERMDRFDGMSERMDKIDAMSDRIDHLNHQIARVRPERSDLDPGKLNRISAEVDRLDTRFEALRSQVQIESRERYEELSAEMQMLETLVKQMAETIASSQQAALAGPSTQELPAPELPAPELAEVPELAGAPDLEEQEFLQDQHAEAPDGGAQREDDPQTAATVQTHASEAGNETKATLEPLLDEIPLINELRQSIESNRIELYLQPIMTLPQRRVRYYEAFTRLRNESGSLLMPGDYISLAESAGIMSVIDNVMLYRSVQVLRRLEQRSGARGVFCNISAHSLLDPEFFPEFLSFMEQNQTLSESMYFEFTQSMLNHAGHVERESLAALSDLGFQLSLDQVTNLDLDFQALQAFGFRFLKLDADILLDGMKQVNAQIHAADIRSYLERYGIKLIISKIEDERTLAGVLNYNIKLGQGFLFSEPRPVRPEVFGDAGDAEAAA
jgi:cyclic-di-GMP phosphodiesterase TipF (flagellum assembly factor)